MSAMIPWNSCKDDFKWDGSLRDIYVRPASLSDWVAIYPLLRKQSAFEFLNESKVVVAPDVIDASFFNQPRPILRFEVGQIPVVFHFFTVAEIECDLDPRYVISQTRLDSLLAFVGQLGDLTNKQVVLTPENKPDEPVISYDPKAGRFHHHHEAS